MAKQAGFKVVPDIPDNLMAKYSKADILAIDTEMQGLRLGRDEVCLVQISDRQKNVCLVRPQPPKAPSNLKTLLENPKVLKLYHYALTDVSFLRKSLGVRVTPYHCTRVMSKIVRTYGNTHSLKDVVAELVGVKIEKEQQLTNWSRENLSPAQLQYAANDVLHLIPTYEALDEMIKARGKLPSGITAVKLNAMCQDYLPTLVELVLNGYGDRDEGWDTGLFAH